MNAVPMIVPDTSTPLMVDVADIDDRNRLRPIDPMRAEQIGASMEDRGQLQAIILRRKSAEELQDDARPYALVIGGHRLAGAKSLGWAEIRAEFRTYDQALQARFDEIDENLHRHELTALDRAIFLAESHRLWIELHPESAHGKAKKLDRLNAESRGVLLIYGLDIALYRISSAFGRTTEELGKRYATAIKRLEGIAAGRGSLETEDAGAGAEAGPGAAEPVQIAPGGVVIDVPERLFTRRRFGGPA